MHTLETEPIHFIREKDYGLFTYRSDFLIYNCLRQIQIKTLNIPELEDCNASNAWSQKRSKLKTAQQFLYIVQLYVSLRMWMGLLRCLKHLSVSRDLKGSK